MDYKQKCKGRKLAHLCSFTNIYSNTLWLKAGYGVIDLKIATRRYSDGDYQTKKILSSEPWSGYLHGPGVPDQNREDFEKALLKRLRSLVDKHGLKAHRVDLFNNTTWTILGVEPNGSIPVDTLLKSAEENQEG